MPNPLTVAGGWTLGIPPPKNAGNQFFDDSEQVLENLQKKKSQKNRQGGSKEISIFRPKIFFFQICCKSHKNDFAALFWGEMLSANPIKASWGQDSSPNPQKKLKIHLHGILINFCLS